MCRSYFESLEGVTEAVSGYAGGFAKNPTYRSIGTGKTGHAETVAVYYNPEKISFTTLVDVFFGSHNPTIKNGQTPRLWIAIQIHSILHNRGRKEHHRNSNKEAKQRNLSW